MRPKRGITQFAFHTSAFQEETFSDPASLAANPYRPQTASFEQISSQIFNALIYSQSLAASFKIALFLYKLQLQLKLFLQGTIRVRNDWEHNNEYKCLWLKAALHPTASI